jgi:hypothetical protein
MAWKVTLEERFIDGHVLERDQTASRFELDHAIDEQEGIAMREHLDDAVYVDREHDSR